MASTSMCNENVTTDKVNESFVFKLSLKDYILRMLILGSRANKYDQRTKNLSSDDIAFIETQIKSGHGEEILTITRDVYNESRAPKLETTLMVLALLSKAEDLRVRKMALELVSTLRTLSQVYSWKNYHSGILNPTTGTKTKGFGRAVKREISSWVLKKSAKDLAYQVTKYMAREGWSFKNILQCTHTSTNTGDDRASTGTGASTGAGTGAGASTGTGTGTGAGASTGASTDTAKTQVKPKKNKRVRNHNVQATEMDLVLRYVVNGFDAMDTLAKKSNLVSDDSVYVYLKAIHEAKHFASYDKDSLLEVIYKHKLTREQIPTWALKDTELLTALLTNKNQTKVTMPLTALLRNLGSMTSHGVFDNEHLVKIVLTHLVHPNTIAYSRIHPVNVLTAWFTYRNGKGNKGHNVWFPNQQIVKILEEMFYLSFKNVEPTGKRICFLIDCSGSMCGQSLCEGVTNAEAAALLAMIFARSETSAEESPNHSFYLFTSNQRYAVGGHTTGLTDVTDVIDAAAPLDTVLKAVQRSDWGTTDISMGILDALKFKRKYDAFVVITDNDVNSGIKPADAMRNYRSGLKLPHAKLVVVATQGSDITIADPDDKYMMDMCGFDSHGPKILQDFIRN